MFSSHKENAPLKGGWALFFRRLLLRNKTFTLSLIAFGIFVLTVGALSSSGVKDQKAETSNFVGNDPERNGDSLQRKFEEIKKLENDVSQKKESLQKLSLDFNKKQDENEEKVLKLEKQILELKAEISQLKKPAIMKEGIEDEPIIKDKQSKEQGVQKQEIQPKEFKEKKLASGNADVEKQNAVREAFLFAWKGYEDHAWGEDELHPVDGSSSNWLNLGLSIVDALDTLHIMGLNEQFKKARDWVATNFHLSNARSDISVFETTIRVIGGFSAAYELSGDKMFLDKAEDVAKAFLPAFKTRTGIPLCTMNVHSGRASNPSWSGGSSILSEVGSLQLEFTYLSNKTGNPEYKQTALRVFDELDKMNKPMGLYPVYVDPNSGTFSRNHITLGALGDSFYEYLMKIWLMSGKTNTKYRRMYDDAMKNVITHLIKYSSPNKLVWIAEYNGGVVSKMDHLVCFAGGMFALGAHGDTYDEHLNFGKEITKTCNEFYVRTATGIGPELVYFQGSNDFEVPSDAKHYLLRPETVESFFVLWRVTHDQIYRDMGWKAFQAINKYCRAQYGFSGIRDVTTTQVIFDNKQQSFFLAETLKYLYLLFSDDNLIPLDKYVFNTEAHPLAIFDTL